MPNSGKLFLILVLCLGSVTACASLPGLIGDVKQYGSRGANKPAERDDAGWSQLPAQPQGGENTISLSVANCPTCPMVNVMVDPDGYWQRSEAGGVITGQSSPALYNNMVQSLAAGGLYNWPSNISIIPSFEATCPQYLGQSQVFFISMSLAGTRQRTLFDAGCAGSNYANDAVAVINQISQNRMFQDILAGRIQPQPISAPQPRAVPQSATATATAEVE